MVAQEVIPDVVSTSIVPPLPPDARGAGSADLVLDQFERDAVTYRQLTEPGAFEHIAAMKEDVATIPAPDEAMGVAEDKRDDSPGARRAAPLLPHGLFMRGHVGRRSSRVDTRSR